MKIAIIGGGAAGLAAAVKAAEKHSVTVFERSGRVGRKIMASGNGRCNLTNTALTADNYADFLKYYNCERAADTVRRFDYNALKSFFESIGLEMFSDEQGRVYPFSENSSCPRVFEMTGKSSSKTISLLSNCNVPLTVEAASFSSGKCISNPSFALPVARVFSVR